MTPSSIELCTIFLLGIFVAITDSNVSINVHGLPDTNGRYSCNTSVVLTCEVTSYTASMEWNINGELESSCFLRTCQSYPPFPGNYSFSNDIANSGISIFNLTVNPLTLSDRGNSFVCSAGTDHTNVTLQVTAVNDDFNINTDESSSMDVSTGCFSPHTMVEFIWRKIQVGSANATSIYKREDGIEFPCTSVCTESGRIKKKSTLIIQEDEDGDQYTFQVEVKYGNALHTNAVHNFRTNYTLKGTTNLPSKSTQTTYIIKNTTTSTDESDTKTTPLTYNDTSIGQINTTEVFSEEPNEQTQIIVFIVAGSSVFVIIIVVILIYIRFLKRKKKTESSKNKMNAEEQEMSSYQL